MARRAPILMLAALLGACGTDGIQSIAGRDGRDAASIADLLVVFAVVSAVFFVAVMAFLAAAWFRRRGKGQDGMPDEEGSSREPLLRTGLVLWIGAVAIGLTGLTVASYFTDRAMDHPVPKDRPALSVEIVANQWWWDVRYHFPDPTRNLRTANELHLPVGLPVFVTLKSNDVIHSFWIPNLGGKQDLIPGRKNDIVLVPERIGQYRGQCAEFCGLQHAHMALDVTVESREDFARWLALGLAPAKPPATPLQQAGYDYFMKRECSACHAIAGTPASGQVAPDLTHLASRRSIGAGTLPMTRGHLYAWVADPQGPKPGNNMPYIGLEPDELHAVVAYLESLK